MNRPAALIRPSKGLSDWPPLSTLQYSREGISYDVCRSQCFMQVPADSLLAFAGMHAQDCVPGANFDSYEHQVFQPPELI